MASSLLVVDDDDGIRSVLEREGFRVTVAGDGERALDLLRYTPVDCIVLDAGPPGVEGLEMCRRLRDAGDETPIILLTAPAGVGQRVQGLEAGADDCLGRPFALEELLARVWGYDFVTDTNVVEVYVLYLRRKLEAAGEPRLLHTVRGAGYVLRES
jgi:DNA-binding response OmpR family regulator